MQGLYAFNGTESDDFGKDKRFLLTSIDNMYNLYLLNISLLIEVQKKAEDYLIKSQNKHLATKEEKNPNRKFVNNEVLKMLVENEQLQAKFEEFNISNWELDGEYVDLIFKAILKSDLYKDYTETRTSSFKEDKAFIEDVFKDIIAPNDKLYDYLEDKKLTWLDDLPTVNTTVLKLLRKVKPDSSPFHFIPKLYKDIEDKEFAIKLITKTLLNQSALTTEINNKTTNWDSERIAQIDLLLLKMGVCEIQNFPSIPTKVTINEYLEISKEYSTPKSRIFINGILDKLVKEYESEGKLNKIGRGLM
ncbi:transcription antitermination factor NusB [Bizionia gelidisalsuginis]|uniref:Transcription antitermination factor NusB n=3 Tax=Bizionia TaxID=283785 RepID=A0A8H2LF21_9FLAO|nr:transcription antitermination factor NusB [Bizionia gelidisalsuginis]TYB80123.1 transcription antitermination factor NusB [Bizionia saleffrena]TYC09712.1 transcription antitermination factor NusB [Bizionia gelidisalsuginis]